MSLATRTGLNILAIAVFALGTTDSARPSTGSRVSAAELGERIRDARNLPIDACFFLQPESQTAQQWMQKRTPEPARGFVRGDLLELRRGVTTGDASWLDFESRATEEFVLPQTTLDIVLRITAEHGTPFRIGDKVVLPMFSRSRTCAKVPETKHGMAGVNRLPICVGRELLKSSFLIERRLAITCSSISASPSSSAARGIPLASADSAMDLLTP